MLLGALRKHLNNDCVAMGPSERFDYIVSIFSEGSLRRFSDYLDADISMMTVHSAKGLEWDTVFIPCPCAPWPGTSRLPGLRGRSSATSRPRAGRTPRTCGRACSSPTGRSRLSRQKSSSTSRTLCFETWAVRAIAFCDSPFTDLSLRTSLALILLAMWNLLVHSTAWQPERNGDARKDV